VSDRNTLSSSLFHQHAQSILELVNVDVTTMQMTHSAVELERVTAVHHSTVVETDHVARL